MKKTAQLIAWILVLQLVGYGMGMMTEASLTPWYTSLTKSSLTPQNFVFGVVWTILYVMIAIAGWQLFHNSKPANITSLQLTFTVQLLLNWLWTPLFFYWHWTGLAFICLLGIVFFTSVFLMLAWRNAKILFGLMLPYWTWVCFASYLNFVIWHSNT